MKILTRKHFNLSPDPWAKLQLPTADMRRVGDMIDAAVTAQAFISILGHRGSGKSHAIRVALSLYENIAVVEPLRLDRDRLSMSDIVCAIIRDLSDETPNRSGEGRAYQIKRLLSETTVPVVLVIDDAHALHGQTLRSLKRLRELSWLGCSPLLGIVLVGQRDKTLSIPEVGLRSDQLWLGGLTKKEIAGALSWLSASAHRDPHKLDPLRAAVIEAEAATAIAATPAARNWLDLQALVDNCLLVAQADGKRSVSKQHVALALDPTIDTVTTMPTTSAPSDAQISNYLANKVASKAEQRKVVNG